MQTTILGENAKDRAGVEADMGNIEDGKMGRRRVCLLEGDLRKERKKLSLAGET